MGTRIYRHRPVISGTMAAIMVVMSVFLFICPQSAMANLAVQMSASVSTPCGHGSAAAPVAPTATRSNCLDQHLATVEQFTKTLYTSEKLLVIAVLLVILLVQGSVRSAAITVARARFTQRTRYRYANIRYATQQKMIRWLVLNNQYAYASVI